MVFQSLRREPAIFGDRAEVAIDSNGDGGCGKVNGEATWEVYTTQPPQRALWPQHADSGVISGREAFYPGRTLLYIASPVATAQRG